MQVNTAEELFEIRPGPALLNGHFEPWIETSEISFTRP